MFVSLVGNNFILEKPILVYTATTLLLKVNFHANVDAFLDVIFRLMPMAEMAWLP
jgi:hypothetical protein